jgi:hypothetical protein
VREREGLVARIRQAHRATATAQDPGKTPTLVPDQDKVSALEASVEHLEQLVQGLQDSAHRESLRLSKRIADLEAQIQPAALGKSLSEDARERGL